MSRFIKLVKAAFWIQSRVSLQIFCDNKNISSSKTASLGSNWLLLEDPGTKCYVKIRGQFTVEQAHRFCDDESVGNRIARVALPENERENQFLVQLLMENRGKNAWIGAERNRTYLTTRTVHGLGRRPLLLGLTKRKYMEKYKNKSRKLFREPRSSSTKWHSKWTGCWRRRSERTIILAGIPGWPETASGSFLRGSMKSART